MGGGVRWEVEIFFKMTCEVAFCSQTSLTKPFPWHSKNLGCLDKLLRVPVWSSQFLLCDRQGMVLSFVFNFSFLLPFNFTGLGW